MKCIACDVSLTDLDLLLDEEFCYKCFDSYMENLKDISGE